MCVMCVAAMMYPEFQYRAPPPSYQASMQEYRLRLLLLDRHSGTPGSAASPPPTYRSHPGSLLRYTLYIDLLMSLHLFPGRTLVCHTESYHLAKHCRVFTESLQCNLNVRLLLQLTLQLLVFGPSLLCKLFAKGIYTMLTKLGFR